MKEIKVGTRLKVNSLIGVVLKIEDKYALIKFKCGNYVYKILGFNQNNIL